MRAPMDRLSRQVSRFVDVSGLRKVATGFEWIGKAASTVLRTLTAIVPVMGALTGAASIAGLAKLVSGYAAWSHELQASADNIGTTTQQLQQFQEATALAGGNAADMTSSLKGLHDTLGNINIGSGNAAQALQWFEKLGISIRDGNGHIRTTTDLMPELIQKIAAMPDPLDRARAANELLGASGDKLIETFRQSSQSFSQWFTDASRYTKLSEEQKGSLQRFGEALGRVGVAFDTMGQQIAAVLARDFGPLLQRFAEFVEKHTPEIIAAVDRISQKFIAWLQGVDWSKVEDGINKLIDGLKWVVTHLDTIKDVAEGIAVAFAVKWGVGIVADIASVVTALAPLTAALLPIVAAIGVVTAYEKNKAGQKEIEDKAKALGFEQQSGGPLGMPTFRNPTTGETLNYDQMLEKQGRPHGGGGWLERGLGALWDRAVKGPAAIQQQGGVAPPSNMNLPTDTVQRGAAISTRLAGDLDLSGPQAAGIVGNLQAESGLKAVQEANPIGGGRGGFGWAQWTGPRRLQFEQYAKEHNLDPRSDEANYGFLRQELKAPENAKLLEQLRALKGPDAAKQAAALVERMYERPAVSNAGVRGNYAEQIAARTPAAPPAQVAQAGALPVPPVPPVAGAPPAPAVPAAPAVAAAPPAQVAQAAPVNGAVDVSITHKNPPPNSAVTATGSGSVNVAPVRVEHQEMASI
jgi:ABC-type transporter Mla subunit MlaD